MDHGNWLAAFVRRASLPVLLAAAALPAAAQMPLPRPLVLAAGDRPAAMFRTVEFDLPSKIVGRTFRIYVYQPLKPPPPAGYPVVTMMDGNGYIGAGALAMFSTEFSDDAPGIMVSVGYPTEDVAEIQRLRGIDLTGTPDLSGFGNTPEYLPKPGDHGGQAAFRRFLLEELRPLIAVRYPTDAGNQALIGHSFGGLFALQTLLRQPDAFRSYVLGSPSIRFNRAELAPLEPAFAARVRSGEVAPRIFVTVGGDEQSAKGLPLGMAKELQDRILPTLTMVDDAAQLAKRLAALPGGPGYEVRFHAFEDENHLTVVPPTIMRGVRFALETGKRSPD